MEYRLDLYKGFMLACDNARAHFNAAKLLTQINYGIATSHLILAAEEGIKAYAIYAKYRDADLYKEDFPKFFTHHKYKHTSIWELENIGVQLFQLFGGLLRELYKNPKKYLNGNEIPEHRKKDLIETIEFFESDDIKQIELKKWCDNADSLKRLGFYLDMNTDKTGWLDPKSITEAQYQESYLIVKEQLESIFNIEETLKEDARK